MLGQRGLSHCLSGSELLIYNLLELAGGLHFMLSRSRTSA